MLFLLTKSHWNDKNNYEFAISIHNKKCLDPFMVIILAVLNVYMMHSKFLSSVISKIICETPVYNSMNSHLFLLCVRCSISHYFIEMCSHFSGALVDAWLEYITTNVQFLQYLELFFHIWLLLSISSACFFRYFSTSNHTLQRVLDTAIQNLLPIFNDLDDDLDLETQVIISHNPYTLLIEMKQHLCLEIHNFP